MNEVIAWAGFAGAWLLVAGPLYQGSVELHELDVDRDAIKASAVRTARQATFAQLSETQREQLTTFRNKATGWFTVATGAALLAAGETWQIVEHHDWPVWLFWLLIAIMVAASVLNTAVRMITDERAQDHSDAEPAPIAEQC
jgi:hypothetical protein